MPTNPVFVDGTVLSGAMLNNMSIDGRQVQSGTMANYYIDNVFWFDDFAQFPGRSLSLGSIYDLTGSDNDPVVNAYNVISGFGFLSMTPPSTAGKNSKFRIGNGGVPPIGANVKFSVGIIDSSTASQQVFNTNTRSAWGIAVDNNASLVSGADIPTNMEGALFYWSGGSFFTHTGTGGAQTQIKITTGSPLVNTYNRWDFQTSAGSVVFYKDGSVISVHSSNLPGPGSISWTPNVEVHTLDTNSHKLRVDYILIDAKRG